MDFLCNHDWQINILSEKFISGVDLPTFAFRILYARKALVCHVKVCWFLCFIYNVCGGPNLLIKSLFVSICFLATMVRRLYRKCFIIPCSVCDIGYFIIY